MSASLAAVYLNIKKEMLHFKHIEEIIRYLEYMKNRAVHFSDSVTDIIKSNANNDIAKRYIDFIGNGAEPVTAWKNAVDSSKMKFTVQERTHVKNFFADMCSSSIEKLDAYGEKSITELTEIKNRLLNEKDRKIKLYSVSAISFGLTVILILI